jgi:multidrug efflux pump
MLGVTFFGLFLTPVFYVLLRTLAKRFEKPARVPAPTHAHAHDAPALEGNQ